MSPETKLNKHIDFYMLKALCMFTGMEMTFPRASFAMWSDKDTEIEYKVLTEWPVYECKANASCILVQLALTHRNCVVAGDVVKLVRESWFDELGEKKNPRIGVKSLNGTHLGCVGKYDREAHLSLFQLPLGEDFAVLSQDAEAGAYPFGGYVSTLYLDDCQKQIWSLFCLLDTSLALTSDLCCNLRCLKLSCIDGKTADIWFREYLG